MNQGEGGNAFSPMSRDGANDTNGQRAGYGAGVSPEPAGEELDIRGYFQLLVEYRQWIVGVTLSITILGLLYAFLAPRKYTAAATVFIDRGAQRGPKDVSNVTSTDLTTEMFFNSQVEIMKSKAVLQSAAETLNLKDDPYFRGKNPVGELRKIISVQRKRDSALFTISVTAGAQKSVAAWANAVAEAYDKVTLRQKLQYLQDADKLMAEQATKMEAEYGRLKQSYGEHLQQTDSYFPENQKTITDSRIQGLELKRNDVLMAKNESEARLSQLRALQNENQDPLTLAFVNNSPGMQDLLQQYNQAEKDLAKLSTQFTPKHPGIVKKQEEIAALRKRIRNQGLLLLQAQQSQQAALNQEYASLTAELANLKQQAISTTQQSSQSESLQAGVESVHKYMEMLVEKMREVDVAASLLSNQVRIVERAETPSSASKPNRKMVVLLSFMLGLMGSVGSILAARAIDTRLRQPEEIEQKLGIPLLGTIPVHTGESLPIVVEAFQNLRTSLTYCSDHGAKNVVMVTSASAGEGKSTIVANLGLTLAAVGDRVLLIDCDARKPTLNKFFHVENKGGLAEFLAGSEENAAAAIRPAGKPGIFILPAGKSPANPPNLFSMEKFQKLIQWAKGEYDWVLLDTPPVLAVTDASIIASQAELTILVGRFGFTHIPLMSQALHQFARIGRPVAGAVLNSFDYSRHYYYNSYYHRHYKYYYGKEAPKTRWEKAVQMIKSKPVRAPRRPTV